MPDRAVCEAVVRQLWPYLDGALPESERERVVRHLEACAECRSHADFASAFLRAVRNAQPSPVAPLGRRVVAALAAEGFTRG